MAASGTMISNTITIDGPAASGKSTVAEALAQKLGYLFFDTGVMYRAVTLAVMERLGSAADEAAVSNIARGVKIDVRPPSQADGRTNDVCLDGEDITWKIRSSIVNSNVSPVSAYPAVRAEMTAQQRAIGQRGKVVMVGRDIGTVVMPDAKLKFYLDASAEVRAQRRYDEVRKRGENDTYEDILESIRQRDIIDSTRAVAPLRPADDAIIINTDFLTKEEVLALLLTYCQESSHV